MPEPVVETPGLVPVDEDGPASQGQNSSAEVGVTPGRGVRIGAPEGGSGANSGLAGRSSNGGGGGGFSARAEIQATSSRSSSKIGIPAWVGWSVDSSAAAGGAVSVRTGG